MGEPQNPEPVEQARSDQQPEQTPSPAPFQSGTRQRVCYGSDDTTSLDG